MVRVMSPGLARSDGFSLGRSNGEDHIPTRLGTR